MSAAASNMMTKCQYVLRMLKGALVSVLALAALSCGDGETRKPVYPVRGQLFADGKPAAGAYALFHPASDADPHATRPHGQVDQDGTFVLSTYGANDGAPVGDYIVTLEWRKTVPGHGPRGPSLLPAEYGTPKESPLRASVKAESNNLPPFEATTRPHAQTRRTPYVRKTSSASGFRVYTD
jgi:hypothetical protein